MKIILLRNAYDFINEALSNALKAETENIRWKYAILNLVQAIELSLKEKLRREHPILIFQKIDNPKFTVNLDTALNRLQNICKLKLSKPDIAAIKKAIALRNEIIHFEFSIDKKKCKLIFAKLLGFLSDFNLNHFGTPIDQVVDPVHWQEAVLISDYAKELFNRALELFKEQNIDDQFIWVCPNCEWETFVFQDEIDKCYICGLQEQVIECYVCKDLFFKRECHELEIQNGSYEDFCLECYEKTIQDDEIYYHEMMSHFWNK